MEEGKITMAISDIKFYVFTEREFARYARARMAIIIIVIACCSFYVGHWYSTEAYKYKMINAISNMVGKVNPPSVNKTDSEG